MILLYCSYNQLFAKISYAAQEETQNIQTDLNNKFNIALARAAPFEK